MVDIADSITNNSIFTQNVLMCYAGTAIRIKGRAAITVTNFSHWQSILVGRMEEEK